MIIFDGVPDPHHLYTLQSGNAAQHSELDVFGQAGIHALDVDFGCAPPFGLQEDLVGTLTGKTHDLVFNGGAIARANTLNNTCVER